MTRTRIPYVLTLAGGSVVKTHAERPPAWAAVSSRLEHQYRYTGKTMAGLGRFMEVDPSLPMIARPEIVVCDLRRHAKGACLNERWLHWIGSDEFGRTDLGRRSVEKVIDACPMTVREYHRLEVAHASYFSAQKIAYALTRIEEQAR